MNQAKGRVPMFLLLAKFCQVSTYIRFLIEKKDPISPDFEECFVQIARFLGY